MSEKVIPTFKTSRDMHRRLNPSESGISSWGISLPFAMLRCRTRLLPSGSKGRFCCARTLIFYSGYPWGAFFCTLSAVRLAGGSTALP